MSFAVTTIGGFLGRDPEAKITSTGCHMCIFPLYWTVRSSNADKICWVKVACYQTQADFCLKYLKKGAFITVTGDLETGEYVLRTGEKKMQLFLKATHVYAADKIQLNYYGNNKNMQSSQRPQTQYNKKQKTSCVFSSDDKQQNTQGYEDMDTYDESQNNLDQGSE